MVSILLIDDNPDDRILAIHELNRTFPDLQVEEIAHLDSLNQALETSQFDLAITDYQLHWSNGLEILQAIKSRYPACPVVMFTNSGNEEIAVEGMKAGLSDYVLKGRRPYRLSIAVKESLEKAKLRQQYDTAVQQLRVSAERYRTISELTSDFAYAYRIERDGTVVHEWITEAFTRISGYLASEIEGHGSWHRLIHPEDLEKVVQHQKSLLSGQIDTNEYRIITKQGEVRWLQNVARPIWDEAKKQVVFIYGAAQDITDRKRAEAEREQSIVREQAARAIAEGAEKRAMFLAEASRLLSSSLDFRTTLTSIAQLTIPHLADWCFIDVIEGNAKLFGEPVIAAANPEKEALVRELKRRYPAPTDANYGPPRVLRTGKSELVSDIPESTVLTIAQDEDHLRLLCQLQATSYMIVPLIVGERKLGTIAFASDQTDRRYDQADLVMAEELARRAAIAIDHARLYQEAKEANQLKDEFLAIVSHELRTPLNTVLGWAQMIRDRKLDEALLTRAIDTIERNARLQTKLIDDILDISRIVQNKIHLTLRPIHLIPIINTVLDDVRPMVEAKAIHLETKLEPNVGQILGDSERLQQIIWNLLVNAVKFTPRGERITVQLIQVNNYAQITVSDTGQGIKADFLPHVFDRFRQADGKTTRAHSGLGLGLAIVRHLVEMHNGAVYAASRGEGQGATFTVQIPLNESCPEPSVDEPMAMNTNLEPLLGLRLLVVDDHVDTLELISFILEQCGAQVTTATSADEALKTIAHIHPDILISDIGMPETDGYTLIRNIRALEIDQEQPIPAIALTAFARIEERNQALEAGFQMHVPKPVEPTELITVISTLIKDTRHR